MESTINKMFDTSNKKENQNPNFFHILLRFSTSSKAYSVKIPSSWTVKRLQKFIEYSFREEVKNSVINLFFGAKKLEILNEHLDKYLKYGNNELIFTFDRITINLVEITYLLASKFTDANLSY